MTKSTCNLKNFIHKVFSPQIAVLSSSSVEDVCQKNNLSFIELLEPFTELNTEITYRDPSSTIISVKDLQICLCDIHVKPPEPAIARRLLNESVSSVIEEDVEYTTIKSGNFSVEIPSAVPWFEKWRETFLKVQFPSDHEFTKHYIACMIVISSEEENPMDTLSNMVQQLQQMLSMSPPKMMPKWFSSSVLRFYILVHDILTGDIKKAEKVYEEMKLTYNTHCCYLLQINSRKKEHIDSEICNYWKKFQKEKENFKEIVNDVSTNDNSTSPDNDHIKIETSLEILEQSKSDLIIHPLSPELESQRIFNDPSILKEANDANNGNKYSELPAACLSQDDIDRIKTLVSNFVINALIPFVETQMQYLNEMVSNKKGVSKSLFSVTKRWFGGPKPGSLVSVPNSHYYHPDSPELQMRRLGDLCFMFCAYVYAFQAYHSAKRDFSADGAWLYYAGTLEMAALSAFLIGQDIKKAQEYTEESVTTYMNTCRMPQFATRVTLCATECLKCLGMNGEAAGRLLQMTSEESDLRSALLLEEASYCFISSRKPCMPRKYAFHLVLAGHRFAKAGQRKHSLRCYRQAYQVYRDKNWSLAEDHIHFTIGKLSSTLKQKEVTVEELAKLFIKPSTQSPTQQASFLKEYFVSLIELSKENGNDLPFLEVPRVDHSSITVTLNVSKSDGENVNGYTLASTEAIEEELNDTRWRKLEENLVAFTNKNLVPVSFRPTINIFSNSTKNSVKPTCVVGERIRTSVDLVNIINIPLHLKSIKLMWKHSDLDGNISSNENVLAETDAIDSVLLEPDSSTKISLHVTLLMPGELHVTGITYTVILQPTSEGAECLTITGYTELKPPELRNISTRDPTPSPVYSPDYRLQWCAIDNAPRLNVYFKNLPSEMFCGEIRKIAVKLRNIGTLPVKRVLFASSKPSSFSGSVYNAKTDVFSLANNAIQPGQSTEVTIFLRASDQSGPASIDLLFFYESEKSSQPKLKYRLVYNTLRLLIHESLYSTVVAKRSILLDRDDTEVMNIRLQIHNKNQTRDNVSAAVFLHQISMFSVNWQLYDVICTNGGGSIKLDQEQTLYITLTARRITEKASYSDLALTSAKDIISSKNKPYCDFTNSVVNVLSNNEDGYFDCTKDNSRTSNLESAFAINSVLILFWKTEFEKTNRDVSNMGQQHLPLLKFGQTYTSSKINRLKRTRRGKESSVDLPISNVYYNNPATKELLLVKIKHPSFVTHSFSVNRMCRVPVDFIVQNCCDCSVEVKLDDSYQSANYNKGNESSMFLWLGIVLQTFVLEAHSSIKMPLCFCAGNTGTYDLSSQIVLSARKFQTEENVFIVQSSVPRTLLHVSNNLL